jgi:hypothetical protein
VPLEGGSQKDTSTVWCSPRSRGKPSKEHRTRSLLDDQHSCKHLGSQTVGQSALLLGCIPDFVAISCRGALCRTSTREVPPAPWKPSTREEVREGTLKQHQEREMQGTMQEQDTAWRAYAPQRPGSSSNGTNNDPSGRDMRDVETAKMHPEARGSAGTC